MSFSTTPEIHQSLPGMQVFWFSGFCVFKDKQLRIGKNNELCGLLAFFPGVIHTVQLWPDVNTSACPRASTEPPGGEQSRDASKPPSQRTVLFDVSGGLPDTSVYTAVWSGLAGGSPSEKESRGR